MVIMPNGMSARREGHALANFNLPNFNPPPVSSSEKDNLARRVAALEDYVRILSRELRYVLSNLDERNFTLEKDKEGDDNT